ncbi:hypothetical protein JCM3765_007043 [Sporobolomyces pararoseus]
MSQVEKPRSSFVYKLHELLSAEHHPEWLRWINNDSFGITSIESQAKAALAPQWEFRSLASFIRQLSYYSFKRLSDRRRSAERRSHSPSLIVFTHTSGNFVRDDISKTLNIPRKLRSRKKSMTAGRRKSSTASSLAFDYEYEQPDRSPTPEPYYSTRSDDEPPTPTHLTLASYQLQPWTAVTDSHVASSPRSLPNSTSSQMIHPTLSARDPASSYDFLPTESPDTRSYPSPVSAPPTSAYSYDSPTSVYRAQYTEPSQYQHASSTTFYYPSSSFSQNSTSSSLPYASNELPPIRAITSGLVAPLSPSEETYSHYTPQQSQIIAPQPLRRPSSHIFAGGEVEESVTAPPSSSVPNGLVTMQQVDPYYPPSPPRRFVPSNQVSSHHHFYPTSYSCSSQASDYQQSLVNRSSEMMYSTTAYR